MANETASISKCIKMIDNEFSLKNTEKKNENIKRKSKSKEPKHVTPDRKIKGNMMNCSIKSLTENTPKPETPQIENYPFSLKKVGKEIIIPKNSFEDFKAIEESIRKSCKTSTLDNLIKMHKSNLKKLSENKINSNKSNFYNLYLIKLIIYIIIKSNQIK